MVLVLQLHADLEAHWKEYVIDVSVTIRYEGFELNLQSNLFLSGWLGKIPLTKLSNNTFTTANFEAALIPVCAICSSNSR